VTGQTSYGRRNAEAISANVASAKEEDARRGEQAAKRGQLGSVTHRCRRGDKPGWRDGRSRADDDHWKKPRRHHHSPPYYVVAPAYQAYPAYGPPVGSLNLGVTLPLR
jgi:hypothetical protein